MPILRGQSSKCTTLLEKIRHSALLFIDCQAIAICGFDLSTDLIAATVATLLYTALLITVVLMGVNTSKRQIKVIKAY